MTGHHTPIDYFHPLAPSLGLVAPAILVSWRPANSVAFTDQNLTNSAAVWKPEPNKWALKIVKFTRVLDNEARRFEQLGHSGLRSIPKIAFVLAISPLAYFGCVKSRLVGCAISHRAQVHAITLYGIAINRRQRRTDQNSQNTHRDLTRLLGRDVA